MPIPNEDEIEVSIFGNGYGECIAVHIGLGKWIIIDSCCAESDSDLPLHLKYLQYLGVNPANAIKLIICTHWHDDHIKGLSEVFKSAGKSSILISDALKKDEFVKLLATFKDVDLNSSFTTGVAELGKIIDIFGQQTSRAKEIKWAIINRTEPIPISDKYQVLVHILSPSDEEILESKRLFTELLPIKKESIKAIADPKRNPYSVVVSFQINADNILFGGDKENVNNANMGWEKICTNFSLVKKPKSSVYKVAHHGSETGHNDRIWSELLNPMPWAVLSTFNRSRIPKTNDVKRILTNTNNAYCAGPTKLKHSPLDTETKKLLRDFGGMDKKMFRVGKLTGHIRLRKNIFNTTPWQVQLFGNAYPLSELLKK